MKPTIDYDAIATSGREMAGRVEGEFTPNEICPKSGIYRVNHHPAHAADHEVTCVKGRTFPPCRLCGHVRFVLVKHAPRLQSHEFFRGCRTGGHDLIPDRQS